MSKPDERLVEGVDYDHGDYDAVGEDGFVGYDDHDDRPWADGEIDEGRDPAYLHPEPDEPDWDSPDWDGNDGSHGDDGEAIG